MGTLKTYSADFPFCIVVGVEFSVASGYALDQAARIARRVPNSQIHAVHVRPHYKPDLENLTRYYVSEKIGAMEGMDGRVVLAHVRLGNVAREIAQLAADVHAELILVGTHDPPHLKTFVTGSVGERLHRIAPCAVLIAGPPRKRAEKHEPEIEPPCPDCVQARFASKGTEWWCVAHGATWWGSAVSPKAKSEIDRVELRH
jgi:nucleotide-binding universal stress UspA family protein